MALFGKNNDNNEVSLFSEGTNEKVYELKKAKTVVRIDDNFIRFARKSTLTNVLLQGLDGEKVIHLKQISAYQLKAPGKTTGYIQLIYPGSQDNKGGVFNAVKDENTLIFDKSDIPVIVEIKNAIENALINK